jgi:hypothetical protein
VPQIKEEVKRIIEISAENELPKSKITEELKQTSPWAIVKKFGVDAIPAGDAQKDYALLRDMLRQVGIYLVARGETEGFYRKIESHGPAFVTTLLSEVSLDDPDLQGLREFVELVHSGPASIIRG